MNTDTGEIRKFGDDVERARFVEERRRKGESWIECAAQPTEHQVKHGLKGHHSCLCGSGKKFRDCCRTAMANDLKAVFEKYSGIKKP